MDFSSLRGKVVVIIGASRGIGRATANLLAPYDVKLVLGARNVEHIDIDNALLLPVDVTDEQSVEMFLSKTRDHYSQIDVLINSAGIGMFDSLLESNTADFDRMIAVNLRGTYLACKHFGKVMKDQQKGQIINLVSIAGQIALPSNGGYTASKFGVMGLSKVLQAELRSEGVQVTSVLPGAVDSPFWNDTEMDVDTSNMIPVDSIAEYLLFLIRQPRHSVVDEMTIMPPGGIL
ncbi:3-oxoacyl-ACP reductase [Gracilibacillus halophilus YIM-C55.5]|uniref:3-oxoacyl-ACP reductase n=1 Tax=Gracilibacillus halophilus YIM-C55.5 TaxID=1308866 RepID=N4WWV8_9BACI|nr:SDR family oxidoreductase [Gracilibacillus halophilus]ENH97541.1 3-oxoacyl-ACP reductase [Gracilibacillus halophilus YIM-C55.5]